MAKKKEETVRPGGDASRPPNERDPAARPSIEVTPAPVGVEIRRWKVSHNNAPEKIVEAESPEEARKLGLAEFGVDPSTPHPVRVWPVREDAP